MSEQAQQIQESPLVTLTRENAELRAENERLKQDGQKYMESMADWKLIALA